MKTPSALLVLFVAITLLTVGCSSGTSSPADPLFRQGDEYLLVLFKGPETRVVYLRPDPDAEEYFILPFEGITKFNIEFC